MERGPDEPAQRYCELADITGWRPLVYHFRKKFANRAENVSLSGLCATLL